MATRPLEAFLFVADTTQNSFSAIMSEIDRIDAVENWYKFFPAAAILICRGDVGALHEALKVALPGQRYFVTRLEYGAKNGWLPKKVWDFMNNPEAVSP